MQIVDIVVVAVVGFAAVYADSYRYAIDPIFEVVKNYWKIRDDVSYVLAVFQLHLFDLIVRIKMRSKKRQNKIALRD